MANIITAPTNFPQRISMYVPGMQYASDVNMSGVTRVPLGAPSAASPTSILNAQSTAAAGTVDVRNNPGAAIGAPYGRNLQVVISATATITVTVRGQDYLGQALTENFAFTSGGGTTLTGVKAFKNVQTVTTSVGVAGTMNVGQGAALGLPYKTENVSREMANGSPVASVGTLQLPSLADPATPTSLDPRGLYTPVTTVNGLNIISAVCACLNDVNSANHGGLHGIAHYAG
jgi:hypothetical protein